MHPSALLFLCIHRAFSGFCSVWVLFNKKKKNNAVHGSSLHFAGAVSAEKLPDFRDLNIQPEWKLSDTLSVIFYNNGEELSE